ncbi:polysaccharide biosynthesis/export family protein [Lyngbya aestuarii]|uniref:polysaccharide biosynthesis/export family protein n=1 Tax=Lyngbya aestuarii TaxID=118322 RepID=UPI00403D6277
MLNLHSYLRVPQSITATLLFCSALPFPAFAQIPSFEEIEVLPSTETQALPFNQTEATTFNSTEAIKPVYILGPGDQIEITVFGYEEFTGGKVILPDGTISLPVVGSIMAADKTPDGLAQELTARLDAYLVNPVVSVNLNTLRPVLINVAGEVQRPGPVQLRSLTTTTVSNSGSTVRASLEGAPTVSSALMEAGGVSQYADIRQIVLRRSLPGGRSTTTTINLWDALRSEQAPQDLILQDGDSIFVPKLTGDETLDRRLVARSSLAPSTVKVRVVGEVKRPGEVQVPPNSSLSSAVAIAGGPTDDAKLSEVAFIRLNEAGTVESQQVDLTSLTDNEQILEGDVIIVPKTKTAKTADTVDRVGRPINTILNILRFLIPFPLF